MCALFEDGALFQFIQRIAFAAVADVIAVNLNKTFVDALKMVNRAQQGRFPRAGRAEDHGHGARFDAQTHVIQRFVRAVVFAQIIDFDAPDGSSLRFAWKQLLNRRFLRAVNE
ncbi:hypothetical protein SRABI106_04241 [Rahnella aquatilis]|nr:hypothetical protein SRABI106_04241 [Rahnella aquatilis]